MSSSITIQHTTDLSGDVSITDYQIIFGGEIFTFKYLKEKIDNVLASASEGDQQSTALCLHVEEFMARVKNTREDRIKLSESFKLEFSSVVSRLMVVACDELTEVNESIPEVKA